MGPGLITSLHVVVHSFSDKRGIYKCSPTPVYHSLCASVHTDKDKPDEGPDAISETNEDVDALPQANAGANASSEDRGSEVFRYLRLFTEWLAAANHVTTRLRGIIRAEGETNIQHNLKLSLIQLDVDLDAAKHAAGAREEIMAYLEHSVDQRKIRDDVRKSAKGWLGLHCKYDLSRQRHFTVHAEAGLMALVSAMHETEGKVRKSIQGDSALKELEKVKAICAVA